MKHVKIVSARTMKELDNLNLIFIELIKEGFEIIDLQLIYKPLSIKRRWIMMVVIEK